MRAAPLIARALRALAVVPASMEAAAVAAASHGVRDPDAAQRLYREWVNDTVMTVSTAWFRSVARDPDGAFLSWTEERLADPYHVSCRAHDTARAAHGEEAALLFSRVRWRQEVAWARRMRGSDNDRIAVLAETWLVAARRDPAKLFRGVMDTFAAEGLADPVYAASAFHLLSGDEILDGRVDDQHWRPLWLRFADREFGRSVNGMARAQMAQLAARARESEWRERVARSRSRQACAVRARRPSLMLAVLRAAAENGLSSDDLVQAEAAFVLGIETGDIDLAAHPRSAWQVFALRLPAWAGRADPPDTEERARRADALDQLTPGWAAALPGEFQDAGASQRRLLAWFDAVALDGTRTPPADPCVDYGMWLVEAARP